MTPSRRPTGTIRIVSALVAAGVLALLPMACTSDSDQPQPSGSSIESGPDASSETQRTDPDGGGVGGIAPADTGVEQDAPDTAAP